MLYHRQLEKMTRFLVIASFLVLTNCVWMIDEHENFKSIYQSNIGKSIDDPTLYKWPHAEKISTQVLLDGHIETEVIHTWGNTRRQTGVCRVFFKYNPVSRIVIGWRYEGKNSDCFITP